MKSKATNFGFGGNTGVLFEIDPRTRPGVTYRSPVNQSFSDTPSFGQVGPILERVLQRAGVIGHSLTIDMTIPQEVMLSAYRDLTDDLAVMVNFNTLEFDFKYDGLGLATLAFNNISGIGRPGTGVLKVDGKEVATQRMERTLPLILQWDENFDVGADTGTPVDDQDYQVPFKFTGTLNKLTLSINRPRLTPADEKQLMQESQRNNRASE